MSAHDLSKIPAVLALAFVFGLLTLSSAQTPDNDEKTNNVAPPADVTAAFAGVLKPDRATQDEILRAYGKLPLTFEANQGQTDARVKFLSHSPRYTLFLTGDEAVLSLHQGTENEKVRALPRGREQRNTNATVRMQLVGANSKAPIRGVDGLPGTSNYFVGNDSKKWRTNVANYTKVRYEGVYPGIDLIYYGNARQLEFDFVVAPGTDPNSIRLKLDGTEKLTIDEKGDLSLDAEGVRFQKPQVYQEVDGRRHIIEGSYSMTAANTVQFRVGNYDRSKPLVIDPVLVYSTYLGGSSADIGAGIAVDSTGSAYLIGSTQSTNFPTKNPLQPTYGGGGVGFGMDAFVAKLNAKGTALVYSTYFGGSGDDRGRGIALDSLGNAYVTGVATSTNFPTVAPFQPALASGGSNAFVAKINPTGSALVYSTYLGGSGGDDEGFGIAVGSAGNAFVTGWTNSSDFPKANPLQPAYGGGSDAFVAQFTSAGSALVYSTHLGGSGFDIGNAIAVDSGGNVYVTGGTDSINFPTMNPLQPAYGGGGQNAFVTKINPTGSALVYSTYFGGSNQDAGYGIAVDGAGNAYVTGIASSANFPTMNPVQPTHGGGQDVFVSKFNPTASALVYSTYLGGNKDDVGLGIAVDGAGNAYATGYANSANFPTVNPIQPGLAGPQDAFVAALNPTGSALYSTYLGGSGADNGAGIAVDSAGNVYVMGTTTSTNFPTMNPMQPAAGGLHEAIVVKIGSLYDATPPAVSVSTKPTTLAPSNGQKVPVTVSGAITDTGGSRLNAGTAAYAVMDEYGQVQPSGSITLTNNGRYSFIVLLEASLAASDRDGRHYTITVSAKDNAGNLGSASTVVTVPYAQGN